MNPPESPLAAAAQKIDPLAAARHLAPISDRLQAVDELISRHLASDVPFVRSAGEYLFAGGGKRVRPALLLLAAELLDRDGEECITYAAVIELIHSATLIHDDIIDHATLRRGQPAVNRLWGNSRTVLLGDWLYTTAMQMALAHDDIEVIKSLCEATKRMTEGELLSLERRGALDLAADEYFEIIDRKTAQLFSAACSIPAVMMPARSDAAAGLARYGRALGRCFQLVDDLLDFTAREDELGKPVLSDLKEGKLTLPLILLVPRLEPSRRAALEHVLEDRGFARTAAEEILAMVEAEGTMEEVEAMATAAAEEARAELAGFAPSAARDALEFAPDFVLHRRS